MLDRKTEKQESFVTVQFNRSTGGNRELFGSSIKHNNIISLSVYEADVDRHLNKDWIHGGKKLIEVNLSPAQYAELLTTMNVGDGVPGTLNYYNGKRIPEPKLQKKADQFKEELVQDMDNTLTKMETTITKAEEFMNKKGALNKAEKAELIDGIKSMKRLMADHLPFFLKQFTRQMRKTVVEAKAEVDAFVLDTIVKTGIEGIKNNMLQIEEENKD